MGPGRETNNLCPYAFMSWYKHGFNLVIPQVDHCVDEQVVNRWLEVALMSVSIGLIVNK